MKNKIMLLAISAMLFALCVPVSAQQPTRIPLIGYLTQASLSAVAPRTEAFRLGLKELGHVEGKNIVIEYRSPEGKFDRLPGLAAELVRLKVDIIVTAGSGATRPAKAATVKIPIVMAQDDDPVANGFVVSLARPGGNITGLSTLSPELSGKRLELLRETVPKLSRVAVFGTSTSPANAQVLRELDLAAGALGVKLQYLGVASSQDIETAFRAAVKGRADAVLMLQNPVHFPQRKQIAELAIKSRLPVIYGRPEYGESGGLMTYGVSFTDLDRRAAVYVDKILKGAKPPIYPWSSRRSLSSSSI